jgi:16S rRNA (adenine1518-N6/adenine1519-N6)-dimethyltransferase
MAQIKKVDQSLTASKTLLHKAGIRPRKRLGQTFLEDPVVIKKIIAYAEFDENDVVIEIGPGLGALTIHTLPYIDHLVAIEKDLLLINLLQERLPTKQQEKITFITGDVLSVDVKELYDRFCQKFRIIGNLPYNISSPFLEKLIINRKYINDAILMFQYEFAKRLTALPKNKSYGALSLISQYYAEISPFIHVKRGAFYPQPKVDSMVVKIDFTTPCPFQEANEVMFRKTVKAAFACRRKTILNSLERGMTWLSREKIEKALTKCLIDSKRRAETLTMDEYIHLSSALRPDKTIS